MRAGPQSHLFRNNRLSSDFNVDVEVFNVVIVKYLSEEIIDHKLKFYMVSF
jgi:hypothetical protein